MKFENQLLNEIPTSIFNTDQVDVRLHKWHNLYFCRLINVNFQHYNIFSNSWFPDHSSCDSFFSYNFEAKPGGVVLWFARRAEAHCTPHPHPFSHSLALATKYTVAHRPTVCGHVTPPNSEDRTNLCPFGFVTGLWRGSFLCTQFKHVPK